MFVTKIWFRVVFIVFLIFICDSSFDAFARDYDYGCPVRKPGQKVSQQAVDDYIETLDYVFTGKVAKIGRSVVGLEVATFKIEDLYKGDKPKDGLLKVIFQHGTFEVGDTVYFVRAQMYNDKNLYVEPFSCPIYFTDKEVISYFHFFWVRFVMGFFIVILFFFTGIKYFRYNDRVKKKKLQS